MFRRQEPRLPLDGDIRRANRGDVIRLVDLWHELMKSHQALDARFTLNREARSVMMRRFQYLIQDRDVLVLVSIANGSVVGFAIGHIDANLPFLVGETIGFISDVYIAAPFRLQGRARRLVDALREWYRGRRVNSIQLHAAARNVESHDFWVKMGFSDFLVRMTAEI